MQTNYKGIYLPLTFATHSHVLPVRDSNSRLLD